MAYINLTAHDQALKWVKANGTRLDILVQEPTTYADVSTHTRGNASVTLTGPGVGSPDGRNVTVPAVTTGTTTGDGTVTHWSLTDGANLLVAHGTLSASKAVSTVVDWSSDAFDITFRAAA